MEDGLGGDRCPVCRADVEAELPRLPGLHDEAEAGLPPLLGAARAALADVPVLRDARRDAARGRELLAWTRDPRRDRYGQHGHDGRDRDRARPHLGRAGSGLLDLLAREKTRRPCAVGGRDTMAERTLFLIKPDAVERRLAGEILGRLERRGLAISRREAPHRRPGARRDALRGAPREAVLRRARRVHHLGAHARARPRGRVGDPRRAHDDGRDEPGRRGAGHDPRRPGARDAEQSRPRLGLARVRGARDRALVPRPWLRTRSRGTPQPGTRIRRSTSRPVAGTGRANEPDWGIWNIPDAEVGFAPRRWRARTWSSSAAGPHTSRRGSPGAAAVPSGSIRRRRRSSRPHGGSRRSSGSSSRWFRRAPRRSRCRTRRSTSPCRSTARACGPIRSCGSPRRHGSCARAGELVFLRDLAAPRPLLAPGRQRAGATELHAPALRQARPDRVAGRGRASSTSRRTAS